MDLIRFTATWFAAMGWHLYRIGTGRPAFKNMSDFWFMTGSFLLVMVLAGLFRWAVLHPASGDQTLLVTSIWQVFPALTLYIAGLYLLTVWRRHSKALFAATLGVSATVDLVVSGLYIVELRDTVIAGGWGMTFELGLMLAAAYQFYQAPDVVKSAGYRATKGNF